MKYFVYILTNKPYGTLYVGVTGNLIRRISQHKNGELEGFTKQYSLKKLVYFEGTDDVQSAIEYEKRLKQWRRLWKIALIEKMNPTWDDLSKDFLKEIW